MFEVYNSIIFRTLRVVPPPPKSSSRKFLLFQKEVSCLFTVHLQSHPQPQHKANTNLLKEKMQPL